MKLLRRLFPTTRPVALTKTAARATFSRSLQLLKDVQVEQSNPDHFYSRLAYDTAELIAVLSLDVNATSLDNLKILDVGGGPGYFAQEFASRGATYIGLEPDVGEMSAAGITISNAVRGDGMNLPFATNSFDITYSSNVAEHVPHPWRMAAEMLRVTKPGGLIVLSYTIWLGPFGGHETGFIPHYISGAYARDRYTKIHGQPPKNSFGTSLFDVSCAAGIRYARSAPAQVVALFPRYHPWWAWWLVRVPIVREFLVSNLVMVLKK